MHSLMAQVLSMSDRVASLTAERPERALSSGAGSPNSSRADGADGFVKGKSGSGRVGGAAREALLPTGSRTPCEGPEPVEPRGLADQTGRARLAPLPSAGSCLQSPEMRIKGASGAASPPPLGPPVGVMWRGEQELTRHAGRQSPAQTLPAQLPPARGDGALLHDRGAAAARRILDCLGLGYGAGHSAAACHHINLSGRVPGPAGAADGMQPAASGNPSEGRLRTEQRSSAQLANDAAGSGQGAQERRGGDPLSVVHIFAVQLAARMAADRQRKDFVTGDLAAAGVAAAEGAGIWSHLGGSSAAKELAAQFTAAPLQSRTAGEQRRALGTSSSAAAEVAGERTAAPLQSIAQDQRPGNVHASSVPVPQRAGELAFVAAKRCGADVRHESGSASSSAAAGPADGPAAALLGRAANDGSLKAGVAEARAHAGAPWDTADISAAAAVAPLQGPLPAAADTAEQPRGAIPRLLAWLDALQPGCAQRAGTAEACRLDAAPPDQAQRASAAHAQRLDAAEPDQAQRAGAAEAGPPADGAAHAAPDPGATGAADPSHVVDAVPASPAGAGGAAPAYHHPNASATSSPAVRCATDGLGEGAGTSASPTASPESVQRASHASSAIAGLEARHSPGLSSVDGSPGLPASPHAAESAAAAEDSLGREHAQGACLHVGASAGSRGGSTEQPLRSSSSSPAVSVAEEEWLQRSPGALPGASAAAPAAPVAATAVRQQPGTPEAQRLLLLAQLPAQEAASAVPAPDWYLADGPVEAMAGEEAGAEYVADAQGASADAAAHALVCSPAADTAAGSINSPSMSGDAVAGARTMAPCEVGFISFACIEPLEPPAATDGSASASRTGPSSGNAGEDADPQALRPAVPRLHALHPRADVAVKIPHSHSPDPSSSPESAGGVVAAAAAGAREAVQGAAGEGANGSGGLCPDASPAAEGSGNASAASCAMHSSPSPAAQALSEQHAGLVAVAQPGADSRRSSPAATQMGGSLAAQQAHWAATTGTKAAAGPVGSPASPAPGPLLAQQADDIAAALLEGLLADATAEIVSAAVQALGDAKPADAAARLSLGPACAHDLGGWAPPPAEASRVPQTEWPGGDGAAMDTMRPGAGLAAAELGAAAAAVKAVARAGAASVAELDLLSTESCAWLCAEEDASASHATDTPRGEQASQSRAAEYAMRMPAAAGHPAGTCRVLHSLADRNGLVIRLHAHLCERALEFGISLISIQRCCAAPGLADFKLI